MQDVRALAVPCYEPGYTLVRKRQTISTNYRKQQEAGQFPANFCRRRVDSPDEAFCSLQRFVIGHNAPCGDGTPTRMACEKFGERPSSCALAAMCAANRSCGKGTEMSSARRS